MDPVTFHGKEFYKLKKKKCNETSKDNCDKMHFVHNSLHFLDVHVNFRMQNKDLFSVPHLNVA